MQENNTARKLQVDEILACCKEIEQYCEQIRKSGRLLSDVSNWIDMRNIERRMRNLIGSYRVLDCSEKNDGITKEIRAAVTTIVKSFGYKEPTSEENKGYSMEAINTCYDIEYVVLIAFNKDQREALAILENLSVSLSSDLVSV
jgi:hypothetical protein